MFGIRVSVNNILKVGHASSSNKRSTTGIDSIIQGAKRSPLAFVLILNIADVILSIR